VVEKEGVLRENSGEYPKKRARGSSGDITTPM